ncbi:MAG: hypothetical protein H6716_26705 [Polyangiaceae bacterium]|nr:hypothetical protein [Polyangiaceae bacterium]
MSLTDLTEADFRERNRIATEQWDAAQIEWPALLAIGLDLQERSGYLTDIASLHARTLQRCGAVHSVRWRIKDPEHLLAKIVRKRARKSAKYAPIDASNYIHIVTDLIGLRALHLFKSEWQAIHQFVIAHWEQVEEPVAYLREGDQNEVRAAYEQAACRTEDHDQGYRSVHYLVASQPQRDKIIAEIQVRTIFEEAWSEIDHRVRYPNFSDDPVVCGFLDTFNRIVGSADELGSFVQTLARVVGAQENEREKARSDADQHLRKIEELATELSKEKQRTDATAPLLKELASEAQALRNTAVGRVSDSAGTWLFRDLRKAIEADRRMLEATRALAIPDSTLRAMTKAAKLEADAQKAFKQVAELDKARSALYLDRTQDKSLTDALRVIRESDLTFSKAGEQFLATYVPVKTEYSRASPSKQEARPAEQLESPPELDANADDD